MISERDEGQAWRDRAILTWSFLGSMPISLLLWLLLAWVMITRPEVWRLLATPTPTPEMVTSSSIVRLEKVVPEPHQPIVPPRPVERRQQQPQPKADRKAQPTPSAAPVELARFDEHAAPQPSPAKTVERKASLSEILAQQNAAFTRETQQINAANNRPISVATIDPRERASSERQYHMNFQGIPGIPNQGDGIITPTHGWGEQGLDCYYGRYWYEYPSGQTEDGDIPWAFCYTRREDPFRLGIRRIPFPLPMPGYRLPSGTQLTKIESEAYDFWVSHQ